MPRHISLVVKELPKSLDSTQARRDSVLNGETECYPEDKTPRVAITAVILSGMLSTSVIIKNLAELNFSESSHSLCPATGDGARRIRAIASAASARGRSPISMASWLTHGGSRQDGLVHISPPPPLLPRSDVGWGAAPRRQATELFTKRYCALDGIASHTIICNSVEMNKRCIRQAKRTRRNILRELLLNASQQQTDEEMHISDEVILPDMPVNSVPFSERICITNRPANEIRAPTISSIVEIPECV
ncbi:hypothetical protein PR048_031456 [Dryococelus australis]|uniref:Uncharacterized protein n=1 Tax=Dryococelus australis TaxID=614101 RepID=A0ABQ9G5B1_9NEOP|nr:hypothetical protein PR048_031456 [Dryococelus australis]